MQPRRELGYVDVVKWLEGGFGERVLSLGTSVKVSDGRPRLAKVSDAYVANVIRTCGFAAGPVLWYALGMTYQSSLIAARMNVFGRPTFQASDLEPAAHARLVAEFERAWDTMAPADGSTPSAAKVREAAGLDKFSRKWPMCHDGLEALLGSVVLSTWTAFETLAGDLWVAAMNTNPKGLADLAGSPTRIAKLTGTVGRERRDKDLSATPGEGGSQMAGETKTIWLRRVRECTEGTYDLRHCMGDLLKDQFKFTSLAGIRRAYSAAFSEKEKRARTATLDAALSDKALDALSAVRNVIVHKAGVADGDYINDTKGVAAAPRPGLDKRLELTGAMVAGLVEPVILRGVELFTAVDRWLTLTGGKDGSATPDSAPDPGSEV